MSHDYQTVLIFFTASKNSNWITNELKRAASRAGVIIPQSVPACIDQFKTIEMVPGAYGSQRKFFYTTDMVDFDKVNIDNVEYYYLGGHWRRIHLDEHPSDLHRALDALRVSPEYMALDHYVVRIQVRVPDSGKLREVMQVYESLADVSDKLRYRLIAETPDERLSNVKGLIVDCCDAIEMLPREMQDEAMVFMDNKIKNLLRPRS